MTQDTDKLVTDEMLDAGMDAYYRALRGEYDGHKNGLTAIYRAMHAARPPSEDTRDKLIERLEKIAARYENQAKFADIDYAAHFHDFASQIRKALDDGGEK
jgi:hypothetical protein